MEELLLSLNFAPLQTMKEDGEKMGMSSVSLNIGT
jgi:hypothetical protein